MSPREKKFIVEAGALIVLTTVFATLHTSSAGEPRLDQGTWGRDYTNYVGSPTLSVGATVRSFQAGTGNGDHPDFRRTATSGPGRYADILAEYLGPDGKPTFRSTGAKVTSEWKDAAGNNISKPRSYITPANGDRAGAISDTPGDAAASSGTVGQWFRDTPGVNTSQKTSLTFTRNGSKYEFNGSLDTITGTPRVDYTAELDFYFVNEANRDWYFLAETDAEIWVYIDGKLVIDGGGLRGLDFRIENGAVITTAPCDAAITVVGAAIQSGSTPCPVTVQATAGGTTYQPFGSFESPTAGNVNTPTGNPRHANLANVQPGTSITVSGRSFLPGRTSAYMTVHSNPANQQVKVLRNGDLVPDIRPYQNQTAAKEYLATYIDPETRRVTIAENQAIFLFELGTTSLTTAAADFQDLVVLITLSQSGSTVTGPSTTVQTTAAAPSLQQRIDLSRLPWLEDRGSYRMQIFFANRTGGSSNLRLDTNIATLNLANRRVWKGAD